MGGALQPHRTTHHDRKLSLGRHGAQRHLVSLELLQAGRASGGGLEGGGCQTDERRRVISQNPSRSPWKTPSCCGPCGQKSLFEGRVAILPIPGRLEEFRGALGIWRFSSTSFCPGPQTDRTHTHTTHRQTDTDTRSGRRIPVRSGHLY